MTCETAEKLRAQFRVIRNDTAPTTAPTGDLHAADTSAADAEVDTAATTFKDWLEDQYHANKTPTQFDDTVVVEVVDFPADVVIGRTVTMMQAKGWSIGLGLHNSAGCRAGSVTLTPPRSRLLKR